MIQVANYNEKPRTTLIAAKKIASVGDGPITPWIEAKIADRYSKASIARELGVSITRMNIWMDKGW